MPILLLSFKIDPGPKLGIGHFEFGATLAEAEEKLRGHADVCPKFGPAFRSGGTIEFPIEIDSIPEADGDAIEEWLEQFQGEPDEPADDLSGEEED